MKKHIDWQIKFSDFVVKHKDKPFKWGSWDCCMFSDACMKALSGESVIPKTLRWKDEKSALEAIREYGKDLNKSIAKAAKAKNLEKVDLNYLQKGDLVVVQQESQLCGVFDGFKVIAPSDHGLVTLPYDKILSAWRIPNV